MGLLSSIGKLLKAIIRAIVNFIKKYLSVIISIVLIVCAIYFAPVIAGWLTSVGAPTWLSTAFTWAGANVTPLLSVAWDGVAALGSAAWSAFSGASIGTKAAIITGVSAAIAPEETGRVLTDVGELAADTVGSLLSGAASSPVGLIAIGILAWWLFSREKEPVVVATPAQPNSLKDDTNVDS